MFKRELESSLKKAVKSFPAVLLTGPRQSGKTTLTKSLFPNFEYVLLESPDTLLELKSDPRLFLEKDVSGWIFDEAQLYPELFSYLQGYLDTPSSKPIIITGSQNFLLSQRIGQSLAGRVAVLELLPLSIRELTRQKKYKNYDAYDVMFEGLYPRPYHENLSTQLWYQSYIQTYLERDVRQLSQIGDLSQFQLFLKLCAGRVGQILNLESLGADCGVSQPTAKKWVSILESSRIIFLLQPHYKNFKKRLVKRPKLYFYDTGILCGLLGIRSKEDLMIYSLKGGVFESLILSDYAKTFYNQAIIPPFYFWRDHRGLEIDCIFEMNEKLTSVEIKSSKTLSPDFISNLTKWSKIASLEKEQVHVVYAGSDKKSLSGISVYPWKLAHKLCLD